MNLGGRRITNTDLCAAFERLGYEDVAAFLASGNVVFGGSGTAATVQRAVTQGLGEQLGYAVPTFLRQAKALKAVAAAEPFADRVGADKRGKLQVVFLAKKPTAKAAKEALRHDCDEDWLALDDSQLYWLPQAGLAEADLDFKALEKILGTTTVRTHNTVKRLVAKFFAD